MKRRSVEGTFSTPTPDFDSYERKLRKGEVRCQMIKEEKKSGTLVAPTVSTRDRACSLPENSELPYFLQVLAGFWGTSIG